MSTAQTQRIGRRMPHRRRDFASRPRLESLGGRLALSFTSGNAVPSELLIGLQSGLTQADIADFYADHGLSELSILQTAIRAS